MSCIIFPHVPKCAGTSFRKQINDAGLKVFLDDDHPPHQQRFFAEACQRRNREFGLLDFNAFDIVFGHFPAARYRRQGYRHVLLLRNPLERAISQYFYWKNQLPEGNHRALHRNPVIADIKADKVGFLEFVTTLKTYRLYLEGMAPKDFLLLGFMHAYPEFLVRLSDILGIPLRASVHERQSVKEPLSEAERSKATAALKEEFKIYDTYRRHWEKQLS